MAMLLYEIHRIKLYAQKERGVIEKMRLLFISTPVGPIGSGIGGGVEIVLSSLAKSFKKQAHDVEVVAPRGSKIDAIKVHQFDGELHIPIQRLKRNDSIPTPIDSVLVNMWKYATEHSEQFDCIINLAYDKLPFEQHHTCNTPIGHVISMSSLNDEMDLIFEKVASNFPNTMIMHSHAQAATFNSTIRKAAQIIECGIDDSLYQYNSNPKDHLAFVGRISREKGIADIFQLAEKTSYLIKVWGYMEDVAYWKEAQSAYPNAKVMYCGFLPSSELQLELGQARAQLMTHKSVEAFGLVVIEALACGTPTIAYDRGAPAEIIQDGRTGFVVPADDIEKMISSINTIDQIKRSDCREHFETKYTIEVFSKRIERWMMQL
jgi:UDP-glucose:tetrahydrobiopterin glucosyltransferase